MKTYQYTAMNAAGQEIQSEIAAAAEGEALAKIRTLGRYPTKIKELNPKRKPAPASAPAHKINFIFGRVSSQSLTTFTRQLSTLQDAGLPILRSLHVLAGQERPGPLQSAISGVAADVESGESLASAMARHPKAFDRLYVNMVQAGETGGILDVILQRLAEFMEKSRKLKRRVVGAMIYPAAVIGFSVLIVTGLMIFIVPKFQVIFKDFHTSLPKITELLMALSNWIAKDFGWLLILGSPLLLFLTLKCMSKSAPGRLAIDTAKFRLPILGRILRKTAVARFTRTLGTLLAAGVPILDALIIARDTVGNVLFESALQKVHNSVREGEPFAAPLRPAKICDNLVINMIDVGEETGDLDKMLLKIADNYDEEVDVLISSLVSLLEPVMIIALGLIVGTIVVALFMPLVSLLDKMNNGGGN